MKIKADIYMRFLAGHSSVLRFAQLAQLGEHEIDINGPIRTTLEQLQSAHEQLIECERLGHQEADLAGTQSFRPSLLKELADQEIAAEYLERVEVRGTPFAFLMALRDVVEAGTATLTREEMATLCKQVVWRIKTQGRAKG